MKKILNLIFLLTIISFLFSEGIHATNKEDNIKVYNKDGNEFEISRDEYRKNVLPGIIKDAWNDEEKLYSATVLTLENKFYHEALDLAKRFGEISKREETSCTLLGIAYMKLKMLKEAKQTFNDYLVKNGNSGIILTNLAKVYSAEGKTEESYQTLWKALTVDPNQDNALDWWGAIHYEKGGANEYLKSMETAAQIAGSWRPQLWIARKKLESGEKEQAIILYKKILQSVSGQGDVLMMISGDLGNNGHLMDSVKLIEPVYNPQKHGIEPGVNLLISYIKLGMKKEAQTLLPRLYKLEIYYWKPFLDQQKAEIEKMK